MSLIIDMIDADVILFSVFAMTREKHLENFSFKIREKSGQFGMGQRNSERT